MYETNHSYLGIQQIISQYSKVLFLGVMIRWRTQRETWWNMSNFVLEKWPRWERAAGACSVVADWRIWQVQHFMHTVCLLGYSTLYCQWTCSILIETFPFFVFVFTISTMLHEPLTMVWLECLLSQGRSNMLIMNTINLTRVELHNPYWGTGQKIQVGEKTQLWFGGKEKMLLLLLDG